MSNKQDLKYCPLCKCILQLKQINFDLAVYICVDLKCEYPVGHECIEVKRSLAQLTEDMQLEEESAKDINKFISTNVVEQTSTNTLSQPTASTSPNDDLIENLDNLSFDNLYLDTTMNSSCIDPDFDNFLLDLLT